MSHTSCRSIWNQQQGFSMLEILVTLAIISIALLGTAGLQMYSLRAIKGSEFRIQAVFLASDIAERMEANRDAAINGSYATGSRTSPSIATADCTVAACSEAGLASFDISQWENNIVSTLPKSSWEIVHTIPGNPSTYTIRISWSDRSSVSTSRGEIFSYTASRIIGKGN